MSLFIPTIPTANQNLDFSQGQLLSNNAGLDTVFGIDHSLFSDATSNKGFHKKVTFSSNNVPVVPTTPPVLFTNIQDGAGNALPGAVPQLFFYSGSAAQGQNNYVTGSTGSTLLPCGIIMKWGQGTIPLNANTTVNFTQGAFPNNCFSVTVSSRNSGNTPGTFNVNGVAVGSFTLYATTAGNFYYLAIGN